MKNIFNPLVKPFVKLVRPDRYIKLDGTSYHSKGIKACLEKPAIKASIIGGVAIVGANLIAQGSWDVTTDKMMHVIMDDCVKDFLWLAPFPLGIDWLRQLHQGIEKKAIDTTGTDLSREQLALKDIDHLESLQKTSTFWFSVNSVLTITLLGLGARYGSLSENSAILDVFDIGLLTYFFSSAYNAKKVLDGDYAVCGKPPKKEEKAKETSKVVGGVTNNTFTPL